MLTIAPGQKANGDSLGMPFHLLYIWYVKCTHKNRLDVTTVQTIRFHDKRSKKS